MAQAKKIEDYLHLYLGCEVQIVRDIEEDFNGDDDFDAPKLGEVGTLIMINDGMTISCAGESEEWNWGVSFEKSRVALWDVRDFKPILRPLSDMSEEEKMDLHWKNISPEVLRWMKEENYALKITEFLYLLSKHFDLFNLIAEGLAIDKTTLKQ